MDIFGEQLIRREVSGSDWAKRIVLAAVAFILIGVLMFLAWALVIYTPVLLAIGIIFGLVWILMGMNTEYEYIITNEDFDFDKISGKRKRKRLVTIKFSTVEEFGKYDGTQGEDAEATVVATDNTGEGIYYIIARHKTHGRTMVLFTPNDKMIGLTLKALPRKIRTETKVQLPQQETAEEE